MTPAKPSSPNRSRAQGLLPRGPALLPEPGSEWAWPAHTHTSSRAHAPHWQEAEGGAGQTQNKQPRLSHFGAAPPLCPDLVRARLGAAAPRPPRAPTSLPSVPRPRPRGAAAGLYWAGPKVEARPSGSGPEQRCCSRGRGQESGCGRQGLEDSAPRALKAEGTGPSSEGGTHTSPHHFPAPKTPARTWDVQ